MTGRIASLHYELPLFELKTQPSCLILWAVKGLYYKQKFEPLKNKVNNN